MSKAFTKETDGDESDDGGKNYVTPKGYRKMKDELDRLLNDERPKLCDVIAWAAGNGDRSENADYTYGKKRLRQIDGRIRFLTKRIQAAEVVDPAQRDSERVFFGATVTIRDEDGDEKTYTIVGVDEIDLNKNRISWVSPLASAILKKSIGDIVTFKSPKGPRQLEIVDVRYEAVD